mgnify:CR=1 FL=1
MGIFDSLFKSEAKNSNWPGEQLEDLGQANGVASLNSSGKVPASQLDIAETVQDNIASALVAGAGVTKEYNDAANTITISSNKKRYRS